MDTQGWLSAINNTFNAQAKRREEERIIKSKKLSEVITLHPINAVIVCNDYWEGTKIIEKLFMKIKLHHGVSFYGAAKILINLEDFQMSSIRAVTTDDNSYRLKGLTINFLLFTKDIEHDIMVNIIKNLYSQIPVVGGVVSRIDQDKI